MLPERRYAENPADFVFIEDDGTVRELTQQERKFLGTAFHPADSGRPYIKSRYGSRTPDGRISGFLPRGLRPRAVQINVLAVLLAACLFAAWVLLHMESP
jgi:hypothetical protein